jgi:succinoglycan biosynthesis transport protein ExoP
MLQTPPPPVSEYEGPDRIDGQLGLADILAFIRRNIGKLALSVLAGAIIGAIYTSTATPIYVARAKILLDKQRPVGKDDPVLIQFTLDAAQIESQIQVLGSEEITRAVVREQALEKDGELMSSEPSLFRKFMNFFRTETSDVSAPRNPSDAQLAYALAVVDDRLNARRVGQSYVIEVSFWSESPAKAARITNAITAAYIRNQLASKAAIAENGTELIAKQISNLRSQVQIAADAVRTGIIDVQNFPSADARVITAASPPLGKSWPRGNLVLLLGAMLGLIPGLIWAAFKELGSQNSRSPGRHRY